MDSGLARAFRRQPRESEKVHYFTCRHLSNSWFHPDPPGQPTKASTVHHPLTTLRELLHEWHRIGRFDDVASLREHLISFYAEAATLARGTSEGLTTPASDFPLFPLLPAEIRLKIWAEALLPRTLHLSVQPSGGACLNGHLPLPRISRVNHEARSVALAHVSPLRREPLSGFLLPADETLSWLVPGVDSVDVTVGERSFLPPGSSNDYAAVVRNARRVSIGMADLRGASHSALRDQAVERRWEGSELRVVVQTVFVEMPGYLPPTGVFRSVFRGAMRELDRKPDSGTDRAVEIDISPSAPDPDVNKFALEGLGSYNTMQASVPHSTHVVTVVDLHDRVRLEEMLAVGDAINAWAAGRSSRLEALGRRSVAFCMDCLVHWWTGWGEGQVERLVLDQLTDERKRARQYPTGILDPPKPWTRMNEQERQTEILRLSRVTRELKEWEAGQLKALPRLIPAVRFKFHWPGIEGGDWENDCKHVN